MRNTETCPRIKQELVHSQETGEIRDNCGVFGIFLKNPTGNLVTELEKGLTELRHRGPIGTGFVAIDSERFYVKKGLGLVPDALPKKDILDTNEQARNAQVAIGHLQLGLRDTLETDEEKLQGIQPFVSKDRESWTKEERKKKKFALAHNGTIKNIAEVAATYTVNPQEHVSDSHMLTSILETVVERTEDMDAALNELLPQLHGGYALQIAQEGTLYAIRDPWGLRPLVLGELNDKNGYVVASETPALDATNATFVEEVERGTIVKITKDAKTTSRIKDVDEAFCGPEVVAFMRSDSVVAGSPVGEIRKRIGKALAQECPAPPKTDLVIATAGSHETAKGYAEEATMDIVTLTRNPEPNPTPITLQEGMPENLPKEWSIPDDIAGKRLILVENVMGAGKPLETLIKQLLDIGAEVHLRLTFPPVTEECDYGMILKQRDEFVSGRTRKQIAQALGVTSLEMLSDRRFAQAIHPQKSENDLCKACTTGEHPLPIPQHAI